MGLALFCPTLDSIRPDGWRWLLDGEVPRERYPGNGHVFAGDMGLFDVAVGHAWPDVDRQDRLEKWAGHAEAGGRVAGSDRQYFDGLGTRDSRRIRTVGVTLTWSPALEVVDNPDCTVCGGRRLGAFAFCQGCCRSGLDGLLPNVPKDARPRHYRPDSDGLAGDRGAAARSRKRWRKRAG